MEQRRFCVKVVPTYWLRRCVFCLKLNPRLMLDILGQSASPNWPVLPPDHVAPPFSSSSRIFRPGPVPSSMDVIQLPPPKRWVEKVLTDFSFKVRRCASLVNLRQRLSSILRRSVEQYLNLPDRARPRPVDLVPQPGAT